MAVQNYEVCVHLFGEWPRGTVLPEFAARWAGDVAELVEREIVKPTKAPVPKAVTDRLAEIAGARAKAAAPAPAVPDTVSAELEQLRAALALANEGTEAQSARADTAAEQVKALTAELADYVATNAHLTKACDEHQAECDRLAAKNAALVAQLTQLTADLEAATGQLTRPAHVPHPRAARTPRRLASS
jgi:septal ring factor EnvC (AmiA/AmiB activator)